MKIKLKYGYDTIAKFNDAKELEEKLNSLIPEHDSPNPAFSLEHVDGNQLIVGLSSELCSIQFTDKELTSYVPKSNSRENDVIVFFLGEHYSEIFKKHCIPFDQVIEIAKAFLVSGELPENIVEWEIFGI